MPDNDRNDFGYLWEPLASDDAQRAFLARCVLQHRTWEELVKWAADRLRASDPVELVHQLLDGMPKHARERIAEAKAHGSLSRLKLTLSYLKNRLALKLRDSKRSKLNSPSSLEENCDEQKGNRSLGQSIASSAKTPGEILDLRDLESLARRAIERLSDTPKSMMRRIRFYRYWYDATQEDVAKKFEISLSSARHKCDQAQKAFNKEMIVEEENDSSESFARAIEQVGQRQALLRDYYIRGISKAELENEALLEEARELLLEALKSLRPLPGSKK